jgi:hypothetical protein
MQRDNPEGIPEGVPPPLPGNADGPSRYPVEPEPGPSGADTQQRGTKRTSDTASTQNEKRMAV